MKGVQLISLLLALGGVLQTNAQTHLPAGSLNYAMWQPFPAFSLPADSNHLHQKWYLSTYAGISAGFGYFNGVGASVISAPVGLQLNYPLNNNWVAFTGVSVAPAFFNFAGAYTNPVLNKSYPAPYMSNAYGLGLDSRVEMGLMYTNDARTFSISGSIGVERSSFPVYPTNRPVTQKNTR